MKKNGILYYYTEEDARNSYKKLYSSLGSLLTLLLKRYKDIANGKVYHAQASSLATTYQKAINNLNMLRTTVLEDSACMNSDPTPVESIRLIKKHLKTFTTIVDRDIDLALSKYKTENIVIRAARSIINTTKFALSKVLGKNSSSFFGIKFAAEHCKALKAARSMERDIEKSLDIEAKIVI
jgi:hypothetical protein